MVEPDKRYLEVTYIDKEDANDYRVMCVDEDYDEVNLSMNQFTDGKKDVMEGSKITMYHDGDIVIKLHVTQKGAKKWDKLHFDLPAVYLVYVSRVYVFRKDASVAIQYEHIWIWYAAY